MASKHFGCDHDPNVVMLFLPRPQAQRLRTRMVSARQFQGM